MSELIQAVLDSEEKSDLRSFFSDLRHQESGTSRILKAYADYCIKYQKPEEFANPPSWEN